MLYSVGEKQVKNYGKLVGKLKYLEKNLSQSHYVHDKSHTD
jgi:hypothetical protein